MSNTPTVTHSIDTDGIGWITFDDPSSRANVFNPPTQAALRAAITALAAEPVKAVVVLSAKEKIFVAGADLKWLGRIDNARDAATASREGQALFGLLADFKVPVVCAIHGACAGGGYELALACHWRIASNARETVIGLPEVGIGLIPGWGGCARLPRLIGGRGAVEHILKAQLLPAADAHRAGLVDELVPAAELRERARTAALKLANEGKPTRAAVAPADDTLLAEQRKFAATRLRGQTAPIAVLDVIAASVGKSLEHALAIEAAGFGEIAASDVAKNLIHVFFLKDAVKKLTVDAWFEKPAAPVPVEPFKRIGVVGAGVMGSGIAQWCAARGYEVVMGDVKPEFVDRGLGVVRGIFDDATKRGKLSADAAAQGVARVKGTTDYAAFADCDLVVEAIVENVEAKQKLFAALAAVVRPDCVLASNTSALPIEELAATATHPERTIGIHFFNPVSRMPLLELVLSPHTTRGTAERVLAFAKHLGKTPVICRSSPGFLVTRVLFFYLNEACLLWEQGVPSDVIDRAMRDWGWPMGPMRLIDEVGVDVTDFIYGEMRHYFPERFGSATICQRMLAAGLKGRKNGASTGFYTYEGGKEALNPAMRVLSPVSATTLDATAIQQRLNGVMIAETKRVLDEGVLQSADDADFALLMGTGFPAFRGGLMRYAKSAGLV
ncbi:MAG: 3-hydroxyacyl-CoA dehydrogenase NAD-binding domain-containing protein [Candidatus Didemnitutus sp.]|nr:3-hydroxyacyl-CoA dehydrogenase NAD-binding domain-containing protein [Candidatus Didemnitutus sp.]